jgi:hypothetical protein
MTGKLNNLKGRTITAVELHRFSSYEPTALTLTLDDSSELRVAASSVHYDQYSRTECLAIDLKDGPNARPATDEEASAT